jgi:transcriptional regulator GlxA family with amidase domain
MEFRREFRGQQLTNSRIAVNSIHAYCGYSNEHSLRWVFTKATGMSPAAWRNRNALNDLKKQPQFKRFPQHKPLR